MMPDQVSSISSTDGSSRSGSAWRWISTTLPSVTVNANATSINVWNRLNVATRQVAGEWKP